MNTCMVHTPVSCAHTTRSCDIAILATRTFVLCHKVHLPDGLVFRCNVNCAQCRRDRDLLLADRRHTVNVSPMAPLSAVVEAALSAEGVQNANPSACKLLLGKKEMDLSTPLRFANLPTGAKLQLVTGANRQSPQC